MICMLIASFKGHVVATLALDGEESLRDRGGLICMLSASLSAC